jgi:hypothetical protein
VIDFEDAVIEKPSASTSSSKTKKLKVKRQKALKRYIQGLRGEDCDILTVLKQSFNMPDKCFPAP